MLENRDKAMLVEIKTKLTTEDVKEQIKRLEKMKKNADLRGDKRAFLGAVAGVVMIPYVKNYALKQGFFVIDLEKHLILLHQTTNLKNGKNLPDVVSTFSPVQ